MPSIICSTFRLADCPGRNCRPGRLCWFGGGDSCRAVMMGLVLIWGLLFSGGLAWADPVPDYNLAVQFYKQRQWERSAEACQDFLKKYPDHQLALNARLYWGQSLVQLQKFQEAREQFRTFLTRADGHPDHALALYRVGECSYFLGDYAAARDELTRYLKQYSEHTLAEWAWVYLGDSQSQLKNHRQAIAVYSTYLDRFPQGQLQDDAQFGLARAYEANGERTKALELFARLADDVRGKRAAEAQFHVAAAHFDGKDYESAVDAFDRVAEQFPQHALAPLAALNAGYACYHLQRYEAAVARFEKAKTSPDYASSATFWTGLCYKALGDYDRAVSILSGAYAADPNQPQAQNLLFQWADSELRARRYGKSMELFGQLVERWPQGELADDAVYSACDAAFLARDLETASRLYDQFTQNYPTSPLMLVAKVLQARILIARGDALKLNGETGDATTLYRQAADLLQQVIAASKLAPTLTGARLHLARAYERLEDYPRALTAADDLLSAGKEASREVLIDARLIRAGALMQLQRYPDAVEEFRRVLDGGIRDEDPAGATALAGMVAALAETEQWQGIAELLDRLQKVDPQDRHFSRTACRIADLAFEKKDWARAAALFGRVVRDYPGGAYHLVALSNLGHAQYEMKEFAEAAQTFGMLAESAMGNAVLRSHALHMQGLAWKQAGKLAEALAAFETGYTEFAMPEDAAAPSSEQLEAALNAYQCAKGGARTASELDRYESADRLYEHAYQELKKQPPAQQGELDKLINEWAGLSYNREKYARADEIYAILVKERPDSPLAGPAQLVLAESAFLAGRMDEARTAFENLAQNAEAADYVRLRSLTLLLDIDSRSQRWEQVLRWGEELIAAFPASQQRDYADFRMGEALLNQGEPDRAAEILEPLRSRLSATDNRPNWWPEVWVQLAAARLRQKDYTRLDEVVAELRRQAEEGSARAVMYKADLLLGRSLENRALFDEARKAYERVIGSETGAGTATAAEAQFRIADSYLKQKNHDAALKEFYKVYVGYSFPEWQAPALYQAAMCEYPAKRWEAAATTLETLIGEFPESEYAAKAREELAKIQQNLTTEKNPRP